MKNAYLFLSIFLFYSIKATADVYVVIYATMHGKTGHAGLAVDKYEIHLSERVIDNHKIVRYDSVKTRYLTYYDFWPKDNAISIRAISKEVEGEYYKFPRSSSERKITVESLCSRGIPHKLAYPCDALLRIKTSPTKDHELGAFLKNCIELNRPFDTRQFNCADFVLQAVEFVVGLKIDAGEYIPFQVSTTPNKLYKALRLLHGVEIVKNADDKAQGSFLRERVLPELLLTSERR